MNRIIKDLPADLYHADDWFERTPEKSFKPHPPSLSASIADLLLRKTPAHAWQAHPRLNPDHKPENSTQFDLGTALHTVLLGGAKIRVIDHADYRTKAAKQARDEAYEKGHTPLLKEQYERVMVIANRAREQIEKHPDIELEGGDPEVSMIWQDQDYGCWCRARPDYLVGDLILDLKLTTTTPHGWDRHAFNMAYDLRAGHYLRGLAHCLDGCSPRYLFLNVERDPPHNLFVTAFDPEALHMAAAKAKEATRRWAMHMSENSWPGWHSETYYYGPPPWQTAEWEQQQYNRGVTEGEIESLEHLYK